MGSLDHQRNFARLGHIRPMVKRPDAKIRLNGGSCRFNGLGISKAIDHDIGPFLGQSSGYGKADAAGGTCYDS
jgi:hypothetical protein